VRVDGLPFLVDCGGRQAGLPGLVELAGPAGVVVRLELVVGGGHLGEVLVPTGDRGVGVEKKEEEMRRRRSVAQRRMKADGASFFRAVYGLVFAPVVKITSER
jgi:hypothetical protein